MYLKLIAFSASLAIATMLQTAAATPANPSESALEEVEVTEQVAHKPVGLAAPATVLNGKELTTKMGHTLGETLKQELGISNQSFGPGVGIPVIRGQSGARVRVLQNGIGSNDVSQLSPDHATSVETGMAEEIEVLRGPATLLYGSGAIGGVVNVIDNRIPTHAFSKPLNLDFDQRYDSAFSETSTALKIEGNKNAWAYHLDGLYRDRGDMAIGGKAINAVAAEALDPTLQVQSNTHGFIPNTFAETLNGSAGVSYLGEPGFVGVGFNQLHNTYGIAPDGGFSSGYADPNTRIDVRQKKYDFKSELNQPFALVEKLKMRLGYTDYFHTELVGGVPGIPYAPGTAFSNKTYEGRIELTHQPLGALNGTWGFQALSSDFAAYDFASAGVTALAAATNIVPATQTNSFAVFGMESLHYGPVNYQLGLRVEDSTLNPNLASSYTAPLHTVVGSNYNYLPVSASLSGLWQVDASNSLQLALTRSQRTPQVQELFANGYHDATRSYELGDPNLRLETSYNLDIGYKYKSDWLRVELDFFNNWANDYIYQQRTGQFVPPGYTPGYTQLQNTAFYYTAAQCLQQSGGSACTPILQSMQAGAMFTGYESKLVFSVLETKRGLLDLTLFSDYTNGSFVATGTAVPRLPPLRFGLQWDYTEEEWSANLRFTRAQAQDRPGAFDTATAGYYLLSVGGQYQINHFQNSKILLFLKGNNLLNENIRNSVSYLRNFAPEPGRGAELGIRISY